MKDYVGEHVRRMRESRDLSADASRECEDHVGEDLTVLEGALGRVHL